MIVPPPPQDLIFDSEVYSNYTLLGFRRVVDGTVMAFEAHDGASFSLLDRDAVRELIENNRIYTFNGNGFDKWILSAALEGHTTNDIKWFCDQIITAGVKGWELGLPELQFNHVDLIEVAPGQGSLKIYAGRLHSKRLQDLPIKPDAVCTAEEKAALRDYCLNSDCVATDDLRRELAPQLSLRDSLTAEYGIDLRSKSDAQIAEAVIRKLIEDRRGARVYRPNTAAGASFHYTPPAWLQFQTQHLRDVLEKVCTATFRVAGNGSVEMPPELDDYAVPIGRGVYRMGIGGLHSSEKCAAHVADDDWMLIDRDVASYYPAIILNCHLAPQHLGEMFLDVYRGIVNRRLEAKRSGDTVTANSLKITINGSFGKLGSKWSTLYSPDLMIQVTLTGQLALLMFIEMLHIVGIEVVSANTDGIVIRCHKSQYGLLGAMVCVWEAMTGFQTEETRYRAVYSRDVNNYVAVKMNGGVKTKGAYNSGEAPLAKNPVNNVCIDALCRYVEHGTLVAETIRGCTDIRRFLTLRKVNGGGQWGDKYLGKTVRWYYSTGGQPITYVSNGNKVAKSDGAMPMMDLVEGIPADLDYDWYIREAESMLRDVGVMK